MSRRTTITGGASAWVGASKPGLAHGGDKVMRLKSGEQRGLLWLRNPVPARRTVESATLFLRLDGSTGAPVDLTVARLAESFQARKTTWSTQPGTVTGTAVTTSGSGDDDEVFAFDVTDHVQAAADGHKWFGWRVSTSHPTSHKVSSAHAGKGAPRLVVSYSTAPQQPTDLSPTVGAVSIPAPVVSADYLDTSGSTTLAAVRVQTATDATFRTVGWDSGEVATDSPSLDLAATTFPPLANGQSTNWRISFKDADGLWSVWSDPASLKYKPLGVVAFTGAAAAGSVTDYTPDMGWSFSGTQTAYRLRVTDPATPGRVVFDTGRTTGAAKSVTLPAGVMVDARTYTATVQAWDQHAREATPGAPAAASAAVSFRVEYTPTAPPATLDAGGNPDRPGALLTITGETPDHFVIERDGRVLETLIDPDDISAGPGRWVYVDATAGSRKQHTYRVRRVVDSLASGNTGPTATWENTGSHGVWIGDPRRNTWVRLSSANLDGLAMSDDAVVHTPVGGRVPVRIVSGMSGLSGGVSGVLADRADGYARNNGLEALRLIKEHPEREYRLVGGDLNVGVLVGDVSWRPEANTTTGNRRTVVSFSIWQTSGFDWNAS
jgi:hypothetical protein